jgi:hypothetical protein
MLSVSLPTGLAWNVGTLLEAFGWRFFRAVPSLFSLGGLLRFVSSAQVHSPESFFFT